MPEHPDSGGAPPVAPGHHAPPPEVSVGDEVCVWNSFLDRWTDGFVVAAVVVDGLRLQRRSDGHVFEDFVFPRQAVMPERRAVQRPGFDGTELDRRRHSDEPERPGSLRRLSD